jgi:hypothetical protein
MRASVVDRVDERRGGVFRRLGFGGHDGSDRGGCAPRPRVSNLHALCAARLAARRCRERSEQRQNYVAVVLDFLTDLFDLRPKRSPARSKQRIRVSYVVRQYPLIFDRDDVLTALLVWPERTVRSCECESAR